MAKIIEEFTREEYQLLYDSFKNYRVYMSDEQEVLSEKILDKVFYPSFDKSKNSYIQEFFDKEKNTNV